MGFDSYYRIYSSEAKPETVTDESTILPFFGFELHKTTSISYSKRSDTYEISSTGGGTYSVTKRPGRIEPHRYEEVVFKRYAYPAGKLEALENRFYDLVKNKYSKRYADGSGRYFAPTKTSYLCTSVREYYGKNCTGNIGCWSYLILGLLPAIACCAYSRIVWGLPAFVLGLIVSAFWCFCPAMLIYLGINHLVETILLKIRPFDKLSRSEKEKWRDKYLNSLRVGIEEANTILREYATLKGYDKI